MVINKSTLDLNYAKKMRDFADKNSIPVLGEIPYDQKIVEATVKQELIVGIDEKLRRVFEEVLGRIDEVV